jgi:hypothetical protein
MRSTRARAAVVGFVLSMGLPAVRTAKTQPASPACAEQSSYISYRVLVYMRAALTDAQKLNQIEKLYPVQAVAKLRTFLTDKVKDKPVDSATVLILKLGTAATAEYKLAGDMSSLADRLDWPTAEVQTIRDIADQFRLNTIKWEALVTSLTNDTTTLDEGWRALGSTKDNPYIAPSMAAALGKAYLGSVDRRKAELRARLVQDDDLAKKIDLFKNSAPATLRYGEIKWDGVAPSVKQKDIEGFERSLERATER